MGSTFSWPQSRHTRKGGENYLVVLNRTYPHDPHMHAYRSLSEASFNLSTCYAKLPPQRRVTVNCNDRVEVVAA